MTQVCRWTSIPSPPVADPIGTLHNAALSNPLEINGGSQRVRVAKFRAASFQMEPRAAMLSKRRRAPKQSVVKKSLSLGIDLVPSRFGFDKK